MMKEVTSAYAQSFRESDWLLRLQHLYLLLVPVILVGLTLYLAN